MTTQEIIVPARKSNKFTSSLDRFFHFSERGSTFLRETGAGCIAFFVAVCALVMNAQILGAAYGNYAGPYLAGSILCFTGSLLLGLLCNLPLVQTANMALSTAVISMITANTGLTYWNVMAITLIAGIIYLAIALTPAKDFLIQALPEGVRKALPAGLGLYTAATALKNAGIIADGTLVQASSLTALPRFYFWIMIAATALYLVYKAFHQKNALLRVFGIMIGVMWIFGIIFYMNQFIGGQTAATLVYHRLNLVFATDGAQPYNIGAGIAGLQIGKVFTEGFNFSGYTGNVFLLFVQGIASFVLLGLYTNTAVIDAVQTSSELEISEAQQRKTHLIEAALSVAAPLFGVAPSGIGVQSVSASEDGGRTGLSSVIASIGFFIASFTWIFIMFFATGTNGAGMWINETEIKLAVYVKDTFAFADLVMVLTGASMLKGIGKVDWKNAKEYIPFIVSLLGIAFSGNLALGTAAGVIAYAILHLISSERREKLAATAILACIMLVFSLLTLNGTAATAKSSSESTSGRGTLGEVKDFSFDFNSGEYSFTGTDNALFYVVRIYNVENGTESVSALAQSDRIDSDSSNHYEGKVDADLVAGDYHAYVLAVASGYTPSSTMLSGTCTAMASPEVSAVWQENGPDLAVKITITAGDRVAQNYTVTVEKDGAEVYRNDNAENGELMLNAADLGTESLSKADRYSVTVEVKPVAGYQTPAPVRKDVEEQRQGGPGGPGGGGMAGFEVKAGTVTFAEGAEEFEYVIGEHQYFHTKASLVDPEPGTTYTYKLAKGDSQAPFDSKMFLYLNEDGTARLTVSAEGPVAATDLSGSWSSDGSMITVTFE